MPGFHPPLPEISKVAFFASSTSPTFPSPFLAVALEAAPAGWDANFEMDLRPARIEGHFDLTMGAHHRGRRDKHAIGKMPLATAEQSGKIVGAYPEFAS